MNFMVFVSAQAPSKLRVFRKKAVARMDGVGATAFRDLQNLVDVEVRLSRGCSTDGERFIRHQNMQRGAIHIRIDRHRGNSQLAAGTDDPHRDLPPISDKNLLEHDVGASTPLMLATD